MNAFFVFGRTGSVIISELKFSISFIDLLPGFEFIWLNEILDEDRDDSAVDEGVDTFRLAIE